MLETGLRPKTLDQLPVPEHYTKGAEVLRITPGLDKNEYARTLPLTDVARAALDSVCPSEGLIFGRHKYRPQLQKAKQVLPPLPPGGDYVAAVAVRRRAREAPRRLGVSASALWSSR
jgi:hypothetical protein